MLHVTLHADRCDAMGGQAVADRCSERSADESVFRRSVPLLVLLLCPSISPHNSLQLT